MTDTLREHNLKHTPARAAIVNVLSRISEPVDVLFILNTVRAEGIDTDRATVFRTMNTFAERGIVRKIELGDGKTRYELASLPHHHHAVCVKCNTIIDIPECGVSAVEQRIASRMQFSVITHSIEFYGTCASCS